MTSPSKIIKLDEVVVNRIAAGEVIQRPANALKELIENSLDAKSTSIQITVKDGGLKSLQILDNGTGIRREDLAIVCERFTTSKLKRFDDLKSISTFGFRGEALASISHVAHLTLTTKTAQDKVAYKASYIDGKLKGPPKPIAGNQGTTILIENLFYNVATRRKALASPAEELNKISEVVTRYAIHNPHVGFSLKKQGEVIPQVRTPHDSTKENNIKLLYGNNIARELINIELEDTSYKFKMHSLITNPNYSSKRMTFLLFINHRLVDSTPIRKMLEEMYLLYLPKKTHPWCYISLEINPSNVDVNVHPTKHEVRFLHEDSIIDRVRDTLDEKLSSTGSARTFYIHARLPQVEIRKEDLEEVLPDFSKNKTKEDKKVYAKDMIRTDSNEQKLDKFDFTITTTKNPDKSGVDVEEQVCHLGTPKPSTRECIVLSQPDPSDSLLTPEPNQDTERNKTMNWSTIIDELSSQTSGANSISFNEQEIAKTSTQSHEARPMNFEIPAEVLALMSSDESSSELPPEKNANSTIADRAIKTVLQKFGCQNLSQGDENDKNPSPHAETNEKESNTAKTPEKETNKSSDNNDGKSPSTSNGKKNLSQVPKFESQSKNNVRREVKLTSVLKLRKKVEDNYHAGLKKILAEMIFIGCVNENFTLIQSDVNLYICKTQKLAEELFYEIMLYDFSNYGVLKFSEPLPLMDLAMLGMNTKEAGWTEEDGPKEDIAKNVIKLLMEKAAMLKEYFSITIDKKGNLRSLPVLLEKYFPSPSDLPIYILRLATEVNWTVEGPCFDGICRETAKFYSHIANDDDSNDPKHVTEHILFPAIKESLLPPRIFDHDSTILQVASLPELYKVFERC